MRLDSNWNVLITIKYLFIMFTNHLVTKNIFICFIKETTKRAKQKLSVKYINYV